MATPEAEHFAALLKELKGRSGRSYGVLAGRLHVSTSTLHRYCNGDAVPNEYAPVERFARLCGATGDELVEVHRRWIVADAARRRPAGAGVVAPAPAPAPASDPAPAPAPAPVVPEAEPASVVPESEPEPVATESVAPVQVPAAGAAGGGGRSPWARLSRRTRVLIAAAGVAALLVPTSVVADLVGARAEGGAAAPGRGERADDDTFFPPATTSPGPSGSPDSAAPSGDPSPSGSADESADEPSGEPSAEPSADEPPDESPEDDGSAAPGTGLGAPPAVTISSYNWEEPCGQFYLLNRGPEGVDPPPPPQDRRGWARKYGGVEGGNTLLQLTVQGTSREAVVLKGLYVRVLSRKAPPPWSAYLMGNGCGSSIVPQTFASDLDTGHPVITPVPGTQGDRTLPARPFPFKVSSMDVEVLNLDMKAAGYDVTWYLELKWSSGGREGTLRIDDHGKPFRTSGMRGRPAYTYGNDEVKWEPYRAG
ncbi:helix-turn-helix domain-containing protein [Streptomyces griseus]|uniref:Helix-turn-helix domain-containing protein n=1 Tax=Streptomyces stephensoniae TaxID=3375367 RepID=A0ABU2WCX8_9ACTN|nr:helix-turn-helix domain-containing protein [Streptomyces griseus]MDT0494907.1 helix-turn-helix domain-containing protein [Streptomyces griseus]